MYFDIKMFTISEISFEIGNVIGEFDTPFR